jgi:hypothetical protein
MIRIQNPHIPNNDEHLSPEEYLKRFRQFLNWNEINPVFHLGTCNQGRRIYLRQYNMCCYSQLGFSIDERLFLLAGCKIGIWEEPKGFKDWLFLALSRQAELVKGHDFFDQWDQILEAKGLSLNRWMQEQGDLPNLSQKSYLVLLRKYRVSLLDL